jgi:hypothetical protein
MPSLPPCLDHASKRAGASQQQADAVVAENTQAEPAVATTKEASSSTSPAAVVVTMNEASVQTDETGEEIIVSSPPTEQAGPAPSPADAIPSEIAPAAPVSTEQLIVAPAPSSNGPASSVSKRASSIVPVSYPFRSATL